MPLLSSKETEQAMRVLAFPRLPADRRLLAQTDAACVSLQEKLLRLDLRSLDISEYNKRNLGYKIRHIRRTLQACGHLLALSLSNATVPLGQFVLVDYGGGCGLFSLLAKQMGVGRVIYSDIYSVSCDDVRRLSDAMGLPLDGIVCGDVDSLASYLTDNSIAISALASYDVIEHVYDIDEFLRRMARLPGDHFRVVHASTANAKNPLYVYWAKRTQREFEYRDRRKKWGTKERDSLESYLGMRREIVVNYAPSLKPEQAERLALSTRGLRQKDIQNCVDEFLRDGRVTFTPDHPTNTCDPYTGNWCERLMRPEWLQGILEDAGLSVQLLSGYWVDLGRAHLRVHLRFAERILNMTISHFGRRAMLVWPYFILCADHKGKAGSTTREHVS
jgi:hypothetical protein